VAATHTGMWSCGRRPSASFSRIRRRRIV
jgi:hypothetical protein